MSTDPNQDINELAGIFEPMLEDAGEQDFPRDFDDLAHALAWEAWVFFHQEPKPNEAQERLFEEAEEEDT